jgi:hypothetical protein
VEPDDGVTVLDNDLVEINRVTALLKVLAHIGVPALPHQEVVGVETHLRRERLSGSVRGMAE